MIQVFCIIISTICILSYCQKYKIVPWALPPGVCAKFREQLQTEGRVPCCHEVRDIPL